MPDNTSKIIEINGIEMKMFDNGGTQYKIKATDGKSYKFYDKKKDGQDTVAFKQFKDMELKVGDNVDIWFKEEQKEYQGKPYTDRLIASFKEAAGRPVAHQTPKSVPQQANTYKAEEQPKDEKFWDKKALKQCLWGYWLEHHTAFKNVSLMDGMLGEAEMTLVADVFDQIEKFADKRFATGWDKAVKTFAEPTSEDQSLADSVPF